MSRNSTLLLAMGLLSLSACHKSRRHRSPPPPPPVPWELAVGQSFVDTNPNIAPPSLSEQSFLISTDTALLTLTTDTGIQSSYDFLLDDAGDLVGLDPNVRIVVAEDFRYSPYLAGLGGGVAGHELILLDGKLLDIFLEYATFLALEERGFVFEDPVQTVDEIVFNHNAFLGETTAGFNYRYFDESVSIQILADAYFLKLLGPVLYHDFAHTFERHALGFLRSQGDFDATLDTHPPFEDDADVLAGMLVAKALCDLNVAFEAFDILAFYHLQRFDPPLTYYDVLSPSFQSAVLSNFYAPLTIRKQSLWIGYDDFLDFWN